MSESESRPGRRPTLADVARLAKVDISLVSRVLRDDPKGFASDETRSRIAEAVRTLDYRPNAAAQGLRNARTMTLGLLLPGFSSPVYISIAHGVEQRARARGHGLVLGTHAAGDPHETIVDMLMHRRVDAILVASGLIQDDALQDLVVRAPRAVVVLNRQVKGVAASVVVRDGDAAALAVRHLADLGHRSIFGIFGSPTLDTMVRRRRGFQLAGEQSGVKTSWIEMPDRDYAAGYEGAVRALHQSEPPTAIVAGTFPMGVGVLAAASRLGKDVPRDLSVVTLHNDQLADFLTPQLTTVSLPTEQMGAEAVDLALAVMAGEEPHRRIVAENPKLLLRGSTAPPPSDAKPRR